MLRAASCSNLQLSSFRHRVQRSNSISMLYEERIQKRVRFSVELEEIRYYAPGKKRSKPFAKMVKTLGKKTYYFLMVQCGMENVKTQLRKLRYSEQTTITQQDYNWDELFEIPSVIVPKAC